MKKKFKLKRIYFLPLCFINSFLTAQDYPSFTVSVFDTAASTGYYFISPKEVTDFDSVIRETQMILDKYGEVIYFHNWPGTRASDFKLQPHGLMSYSNGGKFFIMDSTFTVIDSVVRKNLQLHDEHEFQILPNGHFLFLAAEVIQMDLSSYHIFKNNNVPGSAAAKVRCNIIQEQDSGKNVVFEWHAKDYFVFDDTDSAYLIDTNFVDWNHSNSLELDYDGNILLSSRHFNEITKINRSDSSIIWRFGGMKNQFTFLNDSAHFRKEHDCRRLPNGNITLFDNGVRNPFHPAIAKEYKIDETQHTAALVWSYIYDSTLFSKSRGNVQRLPNGNTMICYGDMHNSSILFSCVDSLGKPIMEVSFADSLVSYRTFNYPVLPWNINRPKITCEEIAGQIFLSVDSGLSSYRWSTGDTVFKIGITDTGKYYVFVPRGSGGFLKSELFNVFNLSNPCTISMTSNPNSNEGLFLYPDPVHEQLQLHFSSVKKQDLQIEIFDTFGKRVYSSNHKYENILSINIAHLEPGIYFIQFSGTAHKFIKI